jgi:hypothetical protein
VGIDNNGVVGVRVTPQRFITPKELDRFAAAIKDIAATA